MDIESIINNRRIIIYGTGNTGKLFWNKYQNEIPIYGCSSSDVNIIPLDNLRVIQYDEIDKNKDFLVICSVSYSEIRKKLLVDGYKLYSDFVNWSIFDRIYTAEKNNKEILVGVGQCEISEICSALSRISIFRKRYEVFYFDERKVAIHGDKHEFIEFLECTEVLNKASYLLRPSVFEPSSVIGFQKLEQLLNKKCNVIKVSLFEFDSYWPQDTAKERTLSKYYVTRPGEKIGAYANRDRIVEQLIEGKHSVKAIMDQIKQKDFFDRDFVLHNHKRSIKRMQLSDRVSDIVVGDFVVNSYSIVKLYCDRGHFGEYLLREYVKNILQYLKLSNGIKELNNIFLDDMFAGINELPIYPSTADILGLEWVTEVTLYRMKGYDQVKLVTFEEYMEKMIEYYINSRKLLECCYFEMPNNMK